MSFNQSTPNKPYASSQLVGLSGGSVNELNAAKAMLEAYVSGERKTRPPKKMLNILEENGIITKKGGRMPKKPPPHTAVMNPEPFEGGKVNRLKKAKKWTSFVKDDIVKDGIDLAAYGYDKYNAATNPYGHAMSAAITGGAKRPPSKWISFVKEYSAKHNIPYGEALKRAGPEYKKMSGSGYGKVGGAYSGVY